MKYLKRFNEGIDGNTGEDDKLTSFIDIFNSMMNGEYEQDDEPSNSDLLSELGDLCNELDMSSQDIKKVIDSGVEDINGLLKIIYDETLQSEIEDGMTNGSGYNKSDDEESDDRKQLVYEAITDMVKNERKGKDNTENLSHWLDNISGDSFDILYNLLAGSGMIDENN